MQALIDAMLAYARVGSGDLDRSMVDCSVAANEAVEALGARLEETGGEVRVGRLPTVYGDAGLLTRVFQNLISNALRFTGPEPPEVEITAERGSGEWVFHVADNGIGVDPRVLGADLRDVPAPARPGHARHGHRAVDQPAHRGEARGADMGRSPAGRG